MSEVERPHNWRDVIWRAWRNCDDEDFARQLFNLVAEEPVGWQGTASLIFWGGFYGAVAGLLLQWVVTQIKDGLLSWDGSVLSIWLGGGVGSVTALLVQLVLYHRLTWRRWLGLLAPNIAPGPFLRRLGRVRQWLSGEQVAMLAGGIVGGLFLGPLGGLAGAWLLRLLFRLRARRGERRNQGPLSEGSPASVWSFGCAGGTIGWLATVLLGILAVVLDLGQTPAVFGGLAVLLAVLLIIGQIVGMFIGLDLGMAGGLVFGLAGGLLGGLLITLASSLSSGVIAGLTIVLINGLVGSIRSSPHIWRWRILWFWWQDWPHPWDLETALRQACVERFDARKVWTYPLLRLDRRKRELGPVAAYVTLLENEEWAERFAARHALVALGGEAVAPLQAIAQDKESPLQRTAAWLLTSIAQDTTTRLSRRAQKLLCPDCAVRYGELSLELPRGRPLTYYGCRVCGKSRGFREWLGPVVAVLDVRMEEEQVERDGALRVNWLLRRQLFDFDWVEVVWALDEEVERFAVQVGNDTDPLRQPRYGKMRCLLLQRGGLSENTLRILRQMFGHVEMG